MPKTILLLGSPDTARAELSFVRALIEARGHEVRSVDRREAIAMASEEYTGSFDAVLGVGDDATPWATALMQTLPVGMPKLMVTALASGDTRPYVGVRDIALLHTVVPVTGLNPLTRRLLSNAAGAVCGMVEQSVLESTDRPLVAATMFGVTTPCVTTVRERLELAGFEVLVFHANGSGGRAMEALIDSGWFVGVVDVTTTEWADEVVGGMRSAGPGRLDAAARAGIPQVVSVGALDIVNFAELDSVPAPLRQRTLHRHNPHSTLMRTTPAECTEIGHRIAEKLNRSRGPVVVVLPLQGVSMIDAEGQPFHDPAADRALFAALRSGLRADIPVIDVNAGINDGAFADTVATNFLAIMKER